MYNCIHGHAPIRLCNSIDMVFDRHPMNTRFANSLNVVIPKPNIEFFKSSLRYSGGSVWNNLNSVLHNAKSIDSFKKNKKKKIFLLKHFPLLYHTFYDRFIFPI